jgi:hypothetical protein
MGTLSGLVMMILKLGSRRLIPMNPVTSERAIKPPLFDQNAGMRIEIKNKMAAMGSKRVGSESQLIVALMNSI